MTVDQNDRKSTAPAAAAVPPADDLRDLIVERQRSAALLHSNAEQKSNRDWGWHHKLSVPAAAVAAAATAAGGIFGDVTVAVIAGVSGIVSAIVVALGLPAKAKMWEKRSADYEHVESEARLLHSDFVSERIDAKAASARLRTLNDLVKQARRTF